jgi:hypothetical protein
LRVSSVLKYAFAWNVDGRHRVVTNGVRYSAYSPVNGAFPSRRAGRFDGNTASLHGRVFSRLGTTIRVSGRRTWWTGSGFVTHHGRWSKTSRR